MRRKKNQVYQVELEAAAMRKDDQYEKLLEEYEESGCHVTHLSVEVRCRGFIDERSGSVPSASTIVPQIAL